jgi:mannosylglycerate hydrolase
MADSATLIVVPHTHWDREWYQTFQQFRMRLVHCVDHVLRLLESDPDFTHFMLDGQMIVLDDYLEVKPENAAQLRDLAREGRLLVGPWYIQPDEFLVGGEAIVRNLLLGRRLAETYGGAMAIGYLPDCFGHIAQLPQILQGFGIDNAVFWRGVGSDVRHSEFWWVAPDGTRVRVMYLSGRNGYSNANRLPLAAEALVGHLESIVTPMLPMATSGAILLMNGTDHAEPQDGLPEALAAASARLAEHGWRAGIGTLPQYVGMVRQANADLDVYQREWRSSELSHLLPGVLSTRMWIKQRNAASEELLTRWADPMAAWAWRAGSEHPTGLLAVAWKLLLQNQPHDSICGCSIDQVHREMVARYDQSDQIAGQITLDALDALARQIDTQALARHAEPEDLARSVPVIVVNPTAGPCDAVATCDLQLAAPIDSLVVSDDQGQIVPHVATLVSGNELIHQTIDRAFMETMLAMVENGRAMGYRVVGVTLGKPDASGHVRLWAAVSDHGELDEALTDVVLDDVRALASDPAVVAFDVTVTESPWAHVRFLARDLPAHGGRAFLVRPRTASDPQPDSDIVAAPLAIENAWLRVAVDPATGTVTLTDKTTGTAYPGLLRFQDGGDVGDLYNYSPPRDDLVVEGYAAPPQIDLIEASAVGARLRVTGRLSLPARCADDRQSRSTERVECAVTTEIALASRARRAEIHCTISNRARDHRLRVLFPAPLVTDVAEADGTFMVNCRPIHIEPPPGGWSDWVEDPVNTQPQKRFVSVSDGAVGLTVANKGLAEYEALPPGEHEGVTVAVTLLRCIDWLSRDDFATRRGHAGPMIHTPEAQMLGEWSFDLALVPHAGTWRDNDALAQREALAFASGVRAQPTDLHAGDLPATWSFATLAPPALVLSTIKRAEDGAGIIVRWYNPTDTEVIADLATAQSFFHVSLVTMSETYLEDLAEMADMPGHHWQVTTPAGAIVTVRLEA